MPSLTPISGTGLQVPSPLSPDMSLARTGTPLYHSSQVQVTRVSFDTSSAHDSSLPLCAVELPHHFRPLSPAVHVLVVKQRLTTP